jgi:histidine triad (HIT) family protein
MKKEDCIFCKIASGEIPSNTIYENSEFKVIMDIAPASKGHVLIIPKEHSKIFMRSMQSQQENYFS